MFKSRESLVGWLLIAILMVGFIFYQQQQFNKQEEEKKLKAAQEATATPADSTVAALSQAGDTTSFQPAATSSDSTSDSIKPNTSVFETAQARDFVLENEVQKLTISSKGGWIKSAELKKYKTWDGQPLILFNEENTQFGLSFFLQNGQPCNTAQLEFTSDEAGVTVTGDEEKTFALRAKATGGGYIEQRYTLKGNSYLVGYTIGFSEMNSVVAANTTFVNLDWKSRQPRLERNVTNERQYASIYLKNAGGDVEHLSQEKGEVLNFSTPVEWISFKHQFFNTTLFSKDRFKSGKLEVEVNAEDKTYMKQYAASLNLPYSPGADNSFSFQLYCGPSKYSTLKSIGSDFENLLHLGPDFWMFHWIKYITKWVFIPVFNFFDQYHLNYGIIILIMTLLLKLALHPLTYKSFESAAKMKLLQPELAELKEKYGDDQARMGQEQMKLYQKAGVSPFGGCLLLLLQMPILMAMYYFFPASIELRQQGFLWASDLTSYDAIVTFQTELPLIGNHISLFTILMTLSSILQAWMSSSMNQMNTQPGMQYLPYIMPVMLMFLFNSFPAGLTYYYLLQNLLGVAHQWVIQKFIIDEKKLHAQMEEHKKNPRPKSGFQKRLEDMYKEAEKRQQRKK